MLDSAWHVFATVGFDACSVRDIVRHSGLSPGSFYNYFPSKEAVFNHLCQQMAVEIRAVTAAARAGIGDPEQMINAGFSAYIAFLQHKPGALDFMARNPDQVRWSVIGEAEGLRSDLARDLATVLSDSRFNDQDIQLIAAVMVSAGAETVIQAARMPEVETEKLALFLADLLVNGLCHKIKVERSVKDKQ